MKKHFYQVSASWQAAEELAHFADGRRAHRVGGGRTHRRETLQGPTGNFSFLLRIYSFFKSNFKKRIILGKSLVEFANDFCVGVLAV